MRVLFIWYQRIIFIIGDSKHNSNSNEQRHRHRHRQASTKKQHVPVRCGVLSESIVILAAAQRSTVLRTKQTKQTHKPRDTDRSIGRSDRYVQPHPIRTYHSNSLLFYGLLPRPHTLIRPFFIVSFLFFPFFCFIFQTPEHTHTHTPSHTVRIQQPTPYPHATTRRTSQQ